MRKVSYLLTLSLLFICSCIGGGNQNSNTSDLGVIDTMRFARGISITDMGDYTKVEIRNPWDTTRMMKRYLLVDRTSKELPQNMESGEVVKVPVQRAVVYTSVHASIIEMLERDSSIAGACEVRFIDSEAIQQRIKSGDIADLGDSTSPNIEKILDIGAEIIISSPFKDTGYGAAEKIGIPIIEGADYMENHPLGRVEWIKFYGLLFGATDRAKHIFTSTSDEYLKLRDLAQKATSKRPTVLSDTKYGGSWFVAGGDSYTATLYRDAGADYIFASEAGSGSIQLSFESVLDRAIHADMWLVKYYRSEDFTYKTFRAEYEPYESFDAFKNHKIYGCNTSHLKYYEETPMYPQYLLSDLIYIFHPELIPDYKSRYFSPLSK